MYIENLLNEYKDKILRFEVYENAIIIHLEDNGVVEIDTNSPVIPLNISHVVTTVGSE